MRGRGVTRNIVAEMRAMRERGDDVQTIGAEFGLHPQVVQRYTRGAAPPKRGRSIAGYGLAVDADRERRIVFRVESGDKMSAIGKDENISAERVRQIVRRYEVRTGEIVPRFKERAAVPHTPKDRLSDAQKLLSCAFLLPETGCWIWVGKIHEIGNGAYPMVGYYRGVGAIAGEGYARRAAFVLWVGIIPQGQTPVPDCGEHLCINPFHLKLRPMKRGRKSGRGTNL
jgi:hypothetical protein